MFINLKYFSDLYDAIISAISGQYEGTFKSKAEARPFAESQEAKPPLERAQIEEAFLKFTHGNGSESGYVKGLAKEIPMHALQRTPSNNDSLNQGERKTAFSTKWLLPTEIQTSPDIILLSESLPLQSEPYSDEFKSQKIRAVEEKGVLPSVIHTERGVSGLILPIKPHMGQEISIHEEAETPMQNLIPEALKQSVFDSNSPNAQPDKPSAFDEFVDKATRIMDSFGTVLLTDGFWDKSVNIKKKELESEPVPFVIPIGQARLGLPPLSLIQEESVPLSSIQEEDLLTKNLTDRINSNKNPLNTVGEKENPIEKDDPIFRNIMKNFVKEEFSNTFNYSNAQTVDRVFERLVNSNEITPDNFLDSVGKRNEYDNTIKKYHKYLDTAQTNQSETDVIKYSFRPEILPSQPPGEAEKFDKKTERGWYNGKKEISLSQAHWEESGRAERPEEEVPNTKPVAQLRDDGKVSAPLNVRLDNSIIEEVGGFLTNQINDFKKVASDMANGVASIFGQDAKASETSKNEEPPSKIQIRSFEELQGNNKTTVDTQGSSQERG